MSKRKKPKITIKSLTLRMPNYSIKNNGDSTSIVRDGDLVIDLTDKVVVSNWEKIPTIIVGRWWK